MKCNNCGATISDDSLFCTSCGAKVTPAEPQANPVQEQAPAQEQAQQEQPQEQAAAQEQAQPQEQAPVQAQQEQPQEQAAAQAQPQEQAQPQPQQAPAQEQAAAQAQPQQQAPVQPQQAQPQQQTWQAAPQGAPAGTETPAAEKKGKVVKTVIIVAVIAAVIALLIFLIVKIVGALSGGGNEKQIVFEKDGALYYMANMDKEDSEIEIADTRECFSNVQLIDDGKSLLYVDEKKSELFVVELGKLKKNTSKNDKYIKEIDSDVSDVYAISSKEIYYVNYDGELFFYNGKESNEIDDDVEYIVSKCGDMLYYQGYDKDMEYVFCGYNTKTEKEDEIADNAYLQAIDSSDEKVYILADDELQVLDGSGKPETLAEDVSSVVDIDTKTGTAYYVKSESETGIAYDYVVDDMETVELKEPVKTDYFTETTPELALDEYDYEEYIDDPDYFFSWLWEDEDCGMYYTYSSNCEAYVYTDKTNWYIFDEERYWDDYYDYEDLLYSVGNTEQLREDLKSEEVNVNKDSLYILDGGKETLIQENVASSYLDADASKKIVVFGCLGEDGDDVSVKLSEIYYASDVQYALDDAYYYSTPDTYYYAVGASEKQELDGIPYNMYATSNDDEIVIGFIEDSVDYDYYEQELILYTVSGKELKEKQSLSDEGCYGGCSKDGFYFFENIKGGEGDLMVYNGGKVKKVAKDVNVDTSSILDDENIIQIDDSQDLILIDKSGKDKKIDKDVNRYTYINSKRIVYVRDDDLYVYTGKDDSQRITKNLDSYGSYWVNEAEASNSYY